jgi:hypothetical protein
MAYAMDESDLTFLTDCMHFINGRCRLDENCRFRHCREAVEKENTCPSWPKKCRNVTCPNRHPTIVVKAGKKKPPITQALVNHPCQPQPVPLLATRQEGFISFFWDIENVPIPKGQRPFDIVQRIRQKLVIEPGLQEADFSCYCNITTIPQENQQSLSHAAVRLVHIPDRKSNAADRQILLDLDRFERVHKPPATVVLISGDIDFVGKLSDLRHHARFRVIVIHNRPAKQELKATVNEHYPWELFTQPQQPINVQNGFDLVVNERNPRTAEPNRSRRSSRGHSARRRDPSPFLYSANVPKPIITNSNVKKYPCPICTSEFESVPSLRQHQMAKNHLFRCGVCDESFISTESQKQHQKDKKHYVLDYKCQQCNRYFAQIESLNQHQQATGHMLGAIQTPDHNEWIPREIPPRSAQLNAQHNNYDDQNETDIILNGIEAIKLHYAKRISKNN